MIACRPFSDSGSPGVSCNEAVRNPERTWTIIRIPLGLLASAAVAVAGVGIRNEWLLRLDPIPAALVTTVVSGALHTSWLICAASGRSPLAASIAWLVSLRYCAIGVAYLVPQQPAFVTALLLQLIPLLLAASLRAPLPFAERLARWRRARTDILLQIRMSDGVLSWLRPAVVGFLTGTAEVPAGLWYRRFVAELTEAEHQLHVQVSGLALPEQLRQSVLTSGASLLRRSELLAGKLALELQREALDAATLCREQCCDLKNLSEAQRQALASQCEAILSNLIRPTPQFAAGSWPGRTNGTSRA